MRDLGVWLQVLGLGISVQSKELKGEVSGLQGFNFWPKAPHYIELGCLRASLGRGVWLIIYGWGLGFWVQV